MAFDIEVPKPDDFQAALTPVWQAFGWSDLDDALLDDERVSWDAMRPLGVRDDGEWVALAGDYPFQLTLPGGAAMAAAGVTMVGVAPTHRRRGLLRALMTRQLDDVVERGHVFAVLGASESSIYGRFGYAPATRYATVEIEARRSAFVAPVEDGGRCRLLPKEDALPIVRDVYDLCRPLRPGMLSRDDWKWELIRRDPVWNRHGTSARFWLVHFDAGGTPDGYATYRVKEDWDHKLPRNSARVLDLFGVDAEVEAALWRHVLDLDLVDRVESAALPIDDPLHWLLVEPRRLMTSSVVDDLWLRILDVPAALEARQYAVADSIVLEVRDPFRPSGAAAGRFRLEAGPEGATCAPTTASADLALGAAELAATYLGGVAPSVLAAARRVDERTPRAAARADALFASRPLPFCNTSF